MAILIHRLLAEQSRCRQLLGEYRQLGSAGAFGSALIQASLDRAEHAAAIGDEASMRQCLADLEIYEENKPKPLVLAASARRYPAAHGIEAMGAGRVMR